MPFTEAHRVSAEETCISGTLVDGNRRALSALVGAAAYQRAVDSLDRDARQRIVEATALSWVSIPDMERLIMACADAADRDPFELNLAMTRESTEQSFRTVWRVLLRFTSDNMILSRTPRVYAKAYDRGRLTAEIASAQRAYCQIHDRPGMSRMTREAFGVGIETVLRVAGRGDALVTPKPTRDGAEYAIRLR